MNQFDRRSFIKSMTMAGVGMSLGGSKVMAGNQGSGEPTKIGIIGLDTSHSGAFTKIIHDPANSKEFSDFKVTCAYPYGSKTLEASNKRIPGFVESIKEMGVKVVDSMDELLDEVDVVLLETNDGHPRLEQALEVMVRGKRMFVDKPVAASLRDTNAIIEASKMYNSPIFSSSSLRYIGNAQAIRNDNLIGEVLGADVYTAASLEPSHPDLFWYGIHGVEILFTVMGTGCKTVSRTMKEGTDIVVGTWSDDRLGTLRGIRNGKGGFGGNVFGSEEISALGPFEGYKPLVANILQFFRTGVTPVGLGETLEIYAFMVAADESKRQGGAPVELEYVLNKARS